MRHWRKGKMILRKAILLILICFSARIFAQEANSLFFYIPNEEEISDYMNLYAYLRAWDVNKVTVDNESLAMIFPNYVGKNTVESLLFEAFLRYTTNKDIQKQILEYLNTNKIDTNFANGLRKLYSSFPRIKRSYDRKEYLFYIYNDSEYDENINLFLFDEAEALNNEIGLLLFNNKWDLFSVTPSSAETSNEFFISYGGDTNSMYIHFKKHTDIDEKNIEAKYRLAYYYNLYKNWELAEIPLEGILKRAGADKITVGYGFGADKTIKTIESATANIYLYNKQTKTLYEVGYFMNFSPININYANRERIFNFLLFQVLFVFIQ
jgi:hypothetical protein